MAKRFNATGDCKPALHYMVNLDSRLKAIKVMIDRGDYFTINRARQYGKTTTLRALNRYLQGEYYVVLMDLQTFGAGEFENESTFSLAFAEAFLEELGQNQLSDMQGLSQAIQKLEAWIESLQDRHSLRKLFLNINNICAASDKPIILLVDEVDSATNNQVFLDFLAQLRAGYIDRDVRPTFQSVILAGVHDVKNLRRKLRPDEAHKINSPWNIAADFKVDMSFSVADITGMLQEYEADYQTGMDINAMAQLIYDYTSGYPYLVSRLCMLMDEGISDREDFALKRDAWTKTGFLEAVKLILAEKNTLFESLSGKLTNYPELNDLMKTILFMGESIAYNIDNGMIDNAIMFGFIKNKQGKIVISNRIFEIRLYNLYLSDEELKKKDIYTASLHDKNQFIIAGHLNVRHILERFVVHFNDLYGECTERFIEEEGRKYFLLYLRPIINGVGNYYIESRTRDLKRTDVIIDYLGEQYIIELKIWRGNEYNSRGEEQLTGYLDEYHLNRGYMLSFNFNKSKQIGVQEIVLGDKVLVEAVV